MKQKSLWDDIEVDPGTLAQPRRDHQVPRETPHHHIKFWFYDSHRKDVIMCSEEKDYYTRYGSDEIWSVQFVGGSLTAAGCIICNPPEEES